MLQSGLDHGDQAMSFLFQPHVHGSDVVVTPDILIDDLVIADCRNRAPGPDSRER